MNRSRVIVLIVISIIVLIAGYFVFRTIWPKPVDSLSPETMIAVSEQQFTASTQQAIKTLVSSTIDGVSQDYSFSASVPSSWQAVSVNSIEAINLYEASAEGTNELEKSQIFIRKFSGKDFLTLSTVNIHNKADQTIVGRQAVRYDIEKKAGVANFPNQPSWRSQRHIVTDIRIEATNPSLFYVIAKRPDLPESIYQAFLNSLVLDNKQSLVPPTHEFTDRITKKKFGTYITMKTSPIQPERFSGYHTGVDVEFTDTVAEVAVKAITDGQVIFSGTATGYGGVIAIQHKISTEPFIGIYGHLDPTSLKLKGFTVSKGEQIAILGDGFTSETDNERKHLHFGLLRGQKLNLAGYLKSDTDLTGWIDPLSVL